MIDSAVIFDLDGVISDTASVHAAAWKAVLDRVLERHDQAHQPFSETVDYEQFVDGKSRLMGIKSFLHSRNLEFKQGDSSDESLESIYGICNRKNRIFSEILNEEGVEIFDDAKDLIEYLYNVDVDMGIGSASKNTRLVLEKGRLTGYFKAILDGVVAEERNIQSKPSPEFYRHAAVIMGLKTHQCIVIEDAISGIISARKSGIGFVIGVARNGNHAKLKEYGADIVVTSLHELSFDHFNVCLANYR